MPRRDMVCVRCRRISQVVAPPWMIQPIGLCNNCLKAGPPTRAEWRQVKALKGQLQVYFTAEEGILETTQSGPQEDSGTGRPGDLGDGPGDSGDAESQPGS